jgi:hypothetical protein
MLEKKVKKSLIETKERKEKKIIEESLVKNRLSMLFEGINSEEDFNSLSEEDKLKLSVKFIQEVSFLYNNGLIVEQDFGGFLKSIFGNAFGSAAQSMFEPFFGKILSSLGLNDGPFKNIIISYLTTNPAEILRSFSDCKLLTKLISEAIVEGMVMSQQDKSGKYKGFIYDFIRNQLGDLIKSNEFISRLQNGLSDTVCSTMGKFTDKAKQVNDNLKGGVINTALS